ncbi:MAG: tRNA (cytidine(34)-2'-O)-methyltransferase [Hyphomicrobium sp.]
MRLALYQPDIAQNTGAILRLAACLATPVDVIGPTGFDMTDRALRRAGLDYLDHVRLTRHESFAEFLAARSDVAPAKSGGRLILLTSHAETSIYDFAFRAEDTLLFGRESAGVPDDAHALADARLRIPIQPGLRSLNLATAAALALGEALRQTGQLPGPSQM